MVISGQGDLEIGSRCALMLVIVSHSDFERSFSMRRRLASSASNNDVDKLVEVQDRRDRQG